MIDFQSLHDQRQETLPPTYRVQDGCHNCRHVFVKTEHDCGAEFFCTLNAPPRPGCMSVAMDEHGWPAASDDWNVWSIPREVKPFGICGEHAAKEGG